MTTLLNYEIKLTNGKGIIELILEGNCIVCLNRKIWNLRGIIRNVLTTYTIE